MTRGLGRSTVRRVSTSEPTLVPRVRRVGLPILVAVFQVVGSFGAAHGQSGRRAPDLLMVVLLLLGPIALYWLRSRPVVVLWATALATLTYLLLQYAYGPVILSFVVAVFSAVMSGHRVASWIATAGLYVGHVGGRLLLGLNDGGLSQMLAVGGWFVVMLVVADLARGQRERRAVVARSREEAERRRVGEERLRIAQELHDVVAHHISLINVQAGVALHLIDRQPGQAEKALAAIKDASKEALVELRSIVGVLRQDDESAPRQPVPGLDRLDHLISRTSQAGLDVQAVIEGSPRPLSPGLDRAAYRIIQESLTNVVRHANASKATVRIQYGEDALVLEIEDDGQCLDGPPQEGNGIVGMRERATALGGDLVTSTTPTGALRVTAHLPL
jgi:signal transduction histidine kinase